MDAVITAAGRSSRMFEDLRKKGLKSTHKLALMIDDVPVLVHTVENVLNCNVDHVTVALGYYQDEIRGILEEYDLTDKISLSYNPVVDIGLSATITNCIRDDVDKNYLFMAADQPTVTTATLNKMISVFDGYRNQKNFISILSRSESGFLDNATGLGMPFCCYGGLLYRYIKDENQNLNPILGSMVKDGVEIYATSPENSVELLNINHYDDYIKINDILSKKKEGIK